jgi:hypothetical protein
MSTLKNYTKDTSAEYDDMVGYVADENITDTLSQFLGEEQEEYRPSVARKKVDAEYPEAWQTLYVNFETEQDYIDFMLAIDEKPMPKLKDVVYKAGREDNGILDLL